MPIGKTVESRNGFITGGTWCVDHNKLVDLWPAEDGVAGILEEDSKGGGPGCNMAVDMRKLDDAMPVETIGLVGDDADGRLLIDIADEFKVDRRQLHVVEGAVTAHSEAYSSKRTRRRTHLFCNGAATLLTPEHFDFAQTTGRILHLGVPGLHEHMDRPWQDEPNGWVAVLKKARRHGIINNLEMATLDPRRLADIVQPCLPYLDMLIVNDAEIGALTGLQTAADGETDIDAVAAAMQNVMASGAMKVVVVHFPKGALAMTQERQYLSIGSVAIPAEEVAAANGAGDAFAAGFLFGSHQGWDTDDALKLAHAAAAASLRSITSSDAVESWQGCLSLAAKWGNRPAPKVSGFVEVS